MRYTISTSSSGIRYDGSTLPKYTLLECTWYLVSLVEAEPDTKWVDRGLITSRHRILSSQGCCVRRYAIHHQYIIAKYTIRLGSTLPKYTRTLLECTWYLVSLVEAEPNTKWVDRGLIISRQRRMLSSHGCCVRTAGTASCGYHTHTIWGRRRFGRGHHVLQGGTTAISSNRSFVTNRFVEP